MSKYRQTFAEAYNSIYESAAAKEIDRKNTRKDSMDYKMLKKAVDLLKSKKYSELKTFLKKSDTSPREYVMFTILMKEPATFKKMYGNQSGYLSLMDKKAPFRISYSKQGQHAGFEDADSLQDLQNKAQKLRAKGFTIDKMGRNTSPVKESFALYAIRPFSDRRAPGGQRKKGDKVSGPMTYTQAVSKAKQMNVGSSVGGTKNVEVRPLKEEDDHEVSMAIGQVRVMQERLSTIMSFLSGKGDDYNIEGWVQSYITSAEESLTTIADYLDKNPEVQKEQKEEPKEMPAKKAEPKKDTDALERQIIALQGQLNMTKQKLENEKNKVVKPEPNPETGEVPLRTGLANAIIDKKGNAGDLLKKVEKKKEIKISGQSKIEVNPRADIGQYSGGTKVNTGNLH